MQGKVPLVGNQFVLIQEANDTRDLRIFCQIAPPKKAINKNGLVWNVYLSILRRFKNYITVNAVHWYAIAMGYKRRKIPVSSKLSGVCNPM